MIGLADRKAGVCWRPSLRLILAGMGLNNNPGLGDRWVRWACLVVWHAVASLRRRSAGVGSHPKGEPPVGSTDPSCLGALVVVLVVPVVGVAAGSVRQFPMDLLRPPCPLLLWLLL